MSTPHAGHRITEHQSWKGRWKLANPRPHFTNTDTGAYKEEDTCPRSHRSSMKELELELPNWRFISLWHHSSSNWFLCSMSYLAFMHSTHSPHPPTMCQQPVRLTQRGLTQLSWPRALYLQSSECHMTLLEAYIVYRDTCDVQVYPPWHVCQVRHAETQAEPMSHL